MKAVPEDYGELIVINFVPKAAEIVSKKTEHVLIAMTDFGVIVVNYTVTKTVSLVDATKKQANVLSVIRGLGAYSVTRNAARIARRVTKRPDNAECALMENLDRIACRPVQRTAKTFVIEKQADAKSAPKATTANDVIRDATAIYQENVTDIEVTVKNAGTGTGE